VGLSALHVIPSEARDLLLSGLDPSQAKKQINTAVRVRRRQFRKR
jgi:hypothetical protein